MPKGPRGEKRPADAIGLAVTVAKIATGEITEEVTPKSQRAEQGAVGGRKRAASLSENRRSEIAKAAAQARWATRPAPSETGDV